jgi:hypothetical protein
MQAIQMHVENTVAHAKEEMGIQKSGRNEMQLSTFRLDHEGQSFCVTGAEKGGKDSAVTVPAFRRPTGAWLQPRPVLMIP